MPRAARADRPRQSPTTLDTVLARLVLAIPPDPALFDELLQWAPPFEPDAAAGNVTLRNHPSPYRAL